MSAIPPDFDPSHFRLALGQFATGVTVITARLPDGHGAGQYAGFTASSFNSLSLAPPLVLWSLGNSAGSLPLFTANTHYAINVLSAGQIELAKRFSSRSILGLARFEGVAFREGVCGAPVILGCCAWFECYNRSRYQEGDHVIFVGEVERCGYETCTPLIFQGGQYHTTRPVENAGADPA